MSQLIQILVTLFNLAGISTPAAEAQRAAVAQAALIAASGTTGITPYRVTAN